MIRFTDTITYCCTAIGVLRAGCTMFLVSTRNGVAGVVDMVQRTGTTHMLVSRDVVIQEIVRDVLKQLPVGQLTTSDMPLFEDLFPVDGKAVNSAFEANVELPKAFDLNSWGMILHSSGENHYLVEL